MLIIVLLQIPIWLRSRLDSDGDRQRRRNAEKKETLERKRRRNVIGETPSEYEEAYRENEKRDFEDWYSENVRSFDAGGSRE